MSRHERHETHCVLLILAAVLVVSVLGAGRAAAHVITEIIDATGDGADNALDNPYGIAVDGAGNAYVTGANTDNAFRITPAGAITEIIDATGDGAGHGLDYAWGVAVDGASNAYVTGANTDSAFKITSAGVITQIIDATGDGAGHGLDAPYGIAVDGGGNAYVAGRWSHNAFKITPAGAITQIIDAAGDGAGHGLNAPYCIAVDGAGNAYVTGLNSDNAFKITPAGAITQIIDATGDGAGHGLDGTYGIAVDSVGNAYVTGYASHNAFKITPAGVITQIIDATGDGAGHGLDTPYGIAVDSAGNAYVVGYSTNNAFKITPAGVITQIIDASGDGAGNALSGSRAIAVNGEANAYVTGQASDNAFEIGPPDCNNNGIPDDQDIAGGTSADCNANGVPDECEAILYVDDSATGLNDGNSWANAYVDLQDALAEANANCAVSEIWVAAGTYKPGGGTGDVMLSFELLDGVALYGGFAGGETDLSQRPLDPDPFTIDPAVDSVLSGDIGVPGDPSDNSNNVVWADLVSSNGILDGFTVTAGNATIGTGFPSYCGGGMFIYLADPTVVNCTFLDNRAVFGGGGMAILYGAPTVVNCTFYNNQNTTDVPGGGGMHIWSGSPRVANCTFAQNSSHAGGGMYIEGFSPRVANCTFAQNSSVDGGGMYIAVGDPTVANCTFRENLATDAPYSRGGGIYNDGGDPTVVNCTFWDNWNDPSTYPEGTGLYTAGGSPTVDNCIFWDPVGAPQISGTLVVTYSDVEGGWPGEGNIDLDPMFADPNNGDLRLLPGSPCIDAANNLALPADIADLDGDGDTSEPIPFDLDGNPRRGDDPDTPDTGYGSSPIVDMGAYELPGDCNGNGVPDLQDIEDGTSNDCNFNHVPDECEPDEDCNNNGIQDICDIAAGTSEDCNLNWVPDECEGTDPVIVINEFNYDDMGTDNYAFIELHNFGATPIDISDWTIDIGDTDIYYTVTIPNPTTIAAGEYWTVGKTDVAGISGAVVDLIDDSLDIGDIDYNQTDANGQTYIALRDPGGEVYDVVAVEMNKGIAFGPPGLAADIYAQIGTGIWGNHVNAENPLTSQSRWLDGLDTNNNGRDFGIQKATPGFSNNQADLMLPTYTENADALTPPASVPDWVFSYMPLRAVDPTVAGSLNPSAIAASPDGGNAMIGWDEAGGGNACYMSQLAKENFTLETYIYIPPTYSPVGWGYEEARIGIRGSTCGVHNFGYANGSTGVCWFWQRGESWQILWLFDENDGNDDTWPAPYSYARYLGGVVLQENDPNTTGWQRLMLEVSSDTVRGIFGGTYGSRGDGIKFSGTHDAPGPGGIYVSYREAMSGTGIPENRPPTLDAITLTDPPLDGDMDLDDDVDLTDLVKFMACMNGPDVSTPPGGCTLDEFGLADLQWDNDVDLGDFAEFQMVFP